jgi:hypothetical protein
VEATKRPSQLYAFAMVDRGFGSNAQYRAAKRFKESLSTKFSSDVFADDVKDEEREFAALLLSSSARGVGFLFLSRCLRSSFSSSSSSVVVLESSSSSSNSSAFPLRVFLRFFETVVRAHHPPP